MSGFKDVVGHKNIIKYIQNAVTADAVSHAVSYTHLTLPTTSRV